MQPEKRLSRWRPALAAWWIAVLSVLTAGYIIGVLSILGHQGSWVAAVGIGFGVARLIAREVGRRFPRQARDSTHRRRAHWTYWCCAFGGFILFAAFWFAASTNAALGLTLLITGAALGLLLNTIALMTAFRAGIKDFAYSQQAD